MSRAGEWTPQTGRGLQLTIGVTDTADYSSADRQKYCSHQGEAHLCKLYEVLCTVCKGWQVGWAGDRRIDGDVDLWQLDLRFRVGGDCWCLLMEGWVKAGRGVGNAALLLTTLAPSIT